jgi:hypothetical protein
MNAQFVNISDECFLVVGVHWISVHTIVRMDLSHKNAASIKLFEDNVDLDKEESAALTRLLHETANKEDWEE